MDTPYQTAPYPSKLISTTQSRREIHDNMDAIGRSLDELNERVRELTTRLQPALNPCAYTATPEDPRVRPVATEPPPMSDLATRLHFMHRELRTAIAGIINVESNLEL